MGKQMLNLERERGKMFALVSIIQPQNILVLMLSIPKILKAGIQIGFKCIYCEMSF